MYINIQKYVHNQNEGYCIILQLIQTLFAVQRCKKCCLDRMTRMSLVIIIKRVLHQTFYAQSTQLLAYIHMTPALQIEYSLGQLQQFRWHGLS